MAGEIFPRFWHPVTRRVNYTIKLEKHVLSLAREMKTLTDTSNDVRSQVEEIGRSGLSIPPSGRDEVRGWLERVEATEAEVSRIEAASEEQSRRRRRSRIRRFFKYFSSSDYRLGKRAAEMLAEVDLLRNEGAALSVDLAEQQSPPHPDPLEMVRSCIEEVGYGVIGIFGKGGVGKTRLMKTLLNDDFLHRRNHGFDLVVWVVVSRAQNVRNIQGAIGDELGLSLPLDEGQSAREILNLLRSKRFLLFFDDIWAQVDLDAIGIPRPNVKNKCKLIFSTQSVAVCEDMNAHKTIEVKPLTWIEAWNLFMRNVCDISSHPEIPRLAEIVAKKCNGLPLALLTMGRAMAGKKTPEEWKNASDLFTGIEEDDVLRLILKFSYDSLRGDSVRSCFLYCSLYPEDYSINKDELIENWIGEGFLSDDDIDEARKKGCDYIGMLKDACLLEDGEDNPETEVKMHDIIRDSASWIAGDYLVQAGVGLTEPPTLELWKEATRISLMWNRLEPLTETPSCPNLTTLMLQCNYRLSNMSSTFFRHMPLLRVLDLSFTGLQEIPVGICELNELQHLKLSGTAITALPGELVSLTKLKHLDLSSTHHLKTIPHMVIAGLSRLRVLNLHGTLSTKWKVDGDDDDENRVDLLAELESLKQLNDLELTIRSNVNGLNRFLGSHVFTKCIRKLKIQKCNALIRFELSLTFGNMKRLQNLWISYCSELEELIIVDAAEVETGANLLLLPSLEILHLHCLFKLKAILVPQVCLQNLGVVDILGCHELKNVTWILHLRSLQHIRLRSCKGIEEVVGGGEVEAIPQDLIAFPRLRKITLLYLPELKSICGQALAFPSLRSVRVYDCPKLKKLPFGCSNSANNTLPEIFGENSWWDGLEWEGESIKSAFLPYFRPRKN